MGLLEQAKAIESWALDAEEEPNKDNPDLDKIMRDVKNINSQARKMLRKIPRKYEWKSVQEILENTSAGCSEIFDLLRKTKGQGDIIHEWVKLMNKRKGEPIPPLNYKKDLKKQLKNVSSLAIRLVKACAELE